MEELKDRLGKHAAELEKLFGKKRSKGLGGEEDEYETSDEDDSDLEFEIQELYDMVKRNLGLLRGEDVKLDDRKGPELEAKEDDEDDKLSRGDEDDKDAQREKWLREQQDKSDENERANVEKAIYDFQIKKNTVLEQQI